MAGRPGRGKPRPYTLNLDATKVSSNLSDLGEAEALGIPGRGGVDGRQHLRRLIHHRPHGFVPRVHEALGNAPLEHQEEILEIRLGIQNNDRAEEKGKALERDGLQKLVKSS